MAFSLVLLALFLVTGIAWSGKRRSSDDPESFRDFRYSRLYSAHSGRLYPHADEERDLPKAS